VSQNRVDVSKREIISLLPYIYLGKVSEFFSILVNKLHLESKFYTKLAERRNILEIIHNIHFLREKR